MKKNEADAVRSLIQEFHDCQWRTTQLQILSTLGQSPEQRSLEFLFQQALRDQTDIPIAEAAVRALGQTHHPMAGRFLSQFFLTCSETLKPSVIGALGAVPDPSCIPEFLKLLPQCVAEKKWLWVRNLILTLGELKVEAATAEILKVLNMKDSVVGHSGVFTAALISLGKTARDLRVLAPFEDSFSSDLLEYQIFSSVRDQIFVRSQLNLTGEMSSSPMAPEKEGEPTFNRDEYLKLSEVQRIQSMNAWTDYGLTVQGNSSLSLKVAKIFEQALDAEKDPGVQARVLRAFAQLRQSSPKITTFLKETPISEIENKDLRMARLIYLKNCTEKKAASFLDESLKSNPKDASEKTALLDALKSLSPSELKQTDSALLQSLLTDSLSDESELRKSALAFLAKHPMKTFIPKILLALKSEEEKTVLAALVTLKASHDESVPEAIQPLLKSTSDSLVGRAIDTLTALPYLRAQRIAVDYLKENSDRLDICDKLIRCLKVEDASAFDYFRSVIESLLKENPDHPMTDALTEFKSRFILSSVKSASGKLLEKGADITAIDKELASKITGYDRLDERVRTTLRSAEVPYLHPKMFDEYVDKSSSVLEYTKAVDLLLECEFGAKRLFSKLEMQLHEFQNTLHSLELNEAYLNAERVMIQLKVEKQFSPQSFPAHKLSLVAQGILSGRILNEQFKTIDGLKAWAVLMLVFSRKTTVKPLIPLTGITDDQIASLAKRLIALQDVRNPAAHRQTFLKFVDIDAVRTEVHQLLNILQKVFG